MKVTDFINKVLNNNHTTELPVVLGEGFTGCCCWKSESKCRGKWSLEAREVMRPVDASMFISVSAPIPLFSQCWQPTVSAARFWIPTA
jgi:hypothetical protein